MAPRSRRSKASERASRLADGRFVKDKTAPDESPTIEHVISGSDDEDAKTELVFFSSSDVNESVAPVQRPRASILGKRLHYFGDSERTRRRNRAATSRALAVCPMNSISSFWQPSTTIAKPDIVPWSNADAIDGIHEGMKKTTANTTHFVRLLALLNFFEKRSAGVCRRDAAEYAAATLPTRLRICGHTVQNWAQFYMETRRLPEDNRGKHQKTSSLINDEDFLKQCVKWLRLSLPGQRTPRHFRQHLVEEVLPLLTGAVKAQVSENTARRWMLRIGYKYGTWKKDRNVFCAEWFRLRDRMCTYSSDAMEIVEPAQDLTLPEIVWV
ncbi:hypothetical protein AC1031_003331 [Aphanomyces cochlioides]|nr:hypothetical protein AC1031_003331 [Aphanomyces cochlioides]